MKKPTDNRSARGRNARRPVVILLFASITLQALAFAVSEDVFRILCRAVGVSLLVIVLYLAVKNAGIPGRATMSRQASPDGMKPMTGDSAKSSTNLFADWLRGWGPIFLGVGVGAFLGVVAYVQHWIGQ